MIIIPARYDEWKTNTQSVSTYDTGWIKYGYEFKSPANQSAHKLQCSIAQRTVKNKPDVKSYSLKSYLRGQLATWCTVYETG